MGGHGLAWAAYERQGEGWEESEAATFLEEDELPWPLLLPVGLPLLVSGGSAAQVCSDRTGLAGAYCQLNNLWALRPYQ